MSESKGTLTEYKSRRKKVNLLRLGIVVIAVLVVLYFAISAVKIVNLTIEKNRVETENERLRNQKEDLEQKLEIVNSNDYLESLARNKLRLVKGNEILFILPTFRSAPDDEQLTPEEELFRLRLQEAEEEALKKAAEEKTGGGKTEENDTVDSELDSGVGAVLDGADHAGDGQEGGNG